MTQGSSHVTTKEENTKVEFDGCLKLKKLSGTWEGQ